VPLAELREAPRDALAAAADSVGVGADQDIAASSLVKAEPLLMGTL
jgi:hypothetical protein